MADPFIAQIVMFGGNFAPRGSALCAGQILPINQNQALFSLLGTTYGGDGRTTFALPDLRGRVPMHPGNGAGLSARQLGERGGTETNTLNVTQMPSHTHTLGVTSSPADDTRPNGNRLAGTRGDAYSQNAADGNLAALGNTGGNQSVNNVQPFTCVNFIIALQGTFPSRN